MSPTTNTATTAIPRELQEQAAAEIAQIDRQDAERSAHAGLQPCRCGAAPRLIDRTRSFDIIKGAFIECRACGLSTGLKDTVAEAVNVWQPAAAGLVGEVLAAAPAAAPDLGDELHGRIMNLPIDDAKAPTEINTRLAYKRGHRDARHAAAELVSEVQAAAPQAPAAAQAQPPKSLEQLQREAGDSPCCGCKHVSAPAELWTCIGCAPGSLRREPKGPVGAAGATGEQP